MEDGYLNETTTTWTSQIKKKFWISSTKKFKIFKCTGYPEHEMCVYGGRYILRIKEC